MSYDELYAIELDALIAEYEAEGFDVHGDMEILEYAEALADERARGKLPNPD